MKLNNMKNYVQGNQKEYFKNIKNENAFLRMDEIIKQSLMNKLNVSEIDAKEIIADSSYKEMQKN